MKKITGCVLLLALVAGSAVFAQTPVWPGKSSKPLVYPYISAVLELPYFIDHRISVDLAGKFYGAKSLFLGPGGYDMAAETSIIEQQIAQKPTAMFISAFEDTLAPSIDSAVKAGIPVFTIDMDTIKSQRQVFIGGDTIDYGRVHARTMNQALNGKGKVLLMWKQGHFT